MRYTIAISVAFSFLLQSKGPKQDYKLLRFANGIEIAIPDLLNEAAKIEAQNLAKNKVVSSIVCRNSSKSYSAQETCAWQLGKQPVAQQLPSIYTSGQKTKLILEDGTVINTILHKRKDAKTLVFVAHGFRDNLTTFAPFLWICEHASVVFFDFRGHNLFNQPQNSRGKLSKKLMGFDAQASCFGAKEEQEVIAVVDYYKKLLAEEHYEKIVGIGCCFGAAMLVKAQTQCPNLFTHLVLDSLWPKLSLLAEKFLSNPYLFIRPRQERKGILAWILSYPVARKSLELFLEWILFGKKFTFELDLCALLQKITVPTFFVYGKHDALIRPQEFEMLWNSVKHSQKYAFINNSKHLLTFLQHRELLKVLISAFLNEELAKYGASVIK